MSTAGLVLGSILWLPSTAQEAGPACISFGQAKRYHYSCMALHTDLRHSQERNTFPGCRLNAEASLMFDVNSIRDRCRGGMSERSSELSKLLEHDKRCDHSGAQLSGCLTSQQSVKARY